MYRKRYKIEQPVQTVVIVYWLKSLIASFGSSNEFQSPRRGWSPEHVNSTTSRRSTALASSRPADTIQDRDAGQQMSARPSTPVSRWALLAGLSSHRTSTPEVGRLRQTRCATDNHSHIGCRNFAVSGPETWNSLPVELRLSILSTATFARLLKAHLFVSTEWHVPAACLILLTAALFINVIIIIIIIILTMADW